MPLPLVEVTRGPLVECIHRGDLAVVDFQGRLIAWAGEPDRMSYLRSSAKPLQTLQVLLSGAADRFGFTEAELAIMCASHYGESFHVAVVESILRKIGLDGSFLRCGTAVSLSADYALEYARQGLELSPFLSDCSGKHAGMLAVCVHRGWDLAGYVSPEHPLQRENLRILADVAEVPESTISIGVDGCSVPVFAMPPSEHGPALRETGAARVPSGPAARGLWADLPGHGGPSGNDRRDPGVVLGAHPRCPRKAHREAWRRGLLRRGREGTGPGHRPQIRGWGHPGHSSRDPLRAPGTGGVLPEETQHFEPWRRKAVKNDLGWTVREIRPTFKLERS